MSTTMCYALYVNNCIYYPTHHHIGDSFVQRRIAAHQSSAPWTSLLSTAEKSTLTLYEGRRDFLFLFLSYISMPPSDGSRVSTVPEGPIPRAKLPSSIGSILNRHGAGRLDMDIVNESKPTFSIVVAFFFKFAGSRYITPFTSNFS